jgi:hypothetical protein
MFYRFNPRKGSIYLPNRDEDKVAFRTLNYMTWIGSDIIAYSTETVVLKEKNYMYLLSGSPYQ